MTDSTATPWDADSLEDWDIRRFVTPDIVEIINRPHEDESPKHRPLWLIWVLSDEDFPRLDSVSDSADSAVYHYGAAKQSNGGSGIFIERIPANHRFGSSLDAVVTASFYRSVVKRTEQRRYKYQRDGD